MFRKKLTRFLMTAGVTCSGFFVYKAFKKDETLEAAYQKLKKSISQRPSEEKYDLRSLFNINCKTTFFDNEKKLIPKKSIEPTVLLNTDLLGQPTLFNQDGSYHHLPALITDTWKDFLDEASDEISITFGHRKAFDANNPIQFTHAIIYVVDSEGRHALFGYSKYNSSYDKKLLVNDANNTTVSRNYTLYQDLTIKGNKAHVEKLFSQIEGFSQQWYSGIYFNCYSPIISGLLSAKEIGMKVPKYFNDSLLIAIPREQNSGYGIRTNRYLRPLSESAIWRNLHKYYEEKSKKFGK